MLLLTTHELVRKKLSLPLYALWAALWLAVIATGIFPDLYAPITAQVGLQTPVQFVTSFSVLAIFMLLFRIYARLGLMERRLTRLAQVVTIERYAHHGGRGSGVTDDPEISGDQRQGVRREG